MDHVLTSEMCSQDGHISQDNKQRNEKARGVGGLLTDPLLHGSQGKK